MEALIFGILERLMYFALIMGIPLTFLYLIIMSLERINAKKLIILDIEKEKKETAHLKLELEKLKSKLESKKENE